MKILSAPFLALVFILILLASSLGGETPTRAGPPIFGYLNSAQENMIEARFLAVPDPNLAKEHLRVLTQAPHMAGTPEDKATADYVAQKFHEAGLSTEISEYRVWMNYPSEISVDITAPAGVHMHGPTREHVDGDPYEDDPRVVMPFSGMSPSGDVEAEVVYANYGTPEDFKKLRELSIDVHGKIVLARYGQNFRGVKVLDAQERGAVGVIIYSDPADDGWRRGDKYPRGPWRPDTSVQRGSIGFMFEFAGDPTTPGVASVPALPDSRRTPPSDSPQLPKIPTTPISYADAWPVLEHLGGPESPRDAQGSLPFTYHSGPGPVKVKLHLKQDYQYRTIWDVTGRVRGSELPDEWVVSGNHRDAWVYGAVDPNSGTAAMLEAVHGIGELLKSGWKPKRTLVLGSWDAEEEGLIGSTEWGEQHERDLVNAVAYFNMDVAVSGPRFGANSVPSLKQFLRDVSKSVPSAKGGGTVYDTWLKQGKVEPANPQETSTSSYRPPVAQGKMDVQVGDLGGGSDYTVFLQHLGVPSADIGSTGSYGVYHSVFDNFQWFTKFGDPDFVYEQQMARVFGIDAIRMADADFIPFDYEEYGKEVASYIETAHKKATAEFGAKSPNFSELEQAAARFEKAGIRMLARQKDAAHDLAQLNRDLREAEHALLLPQGLPDRPWYRHAIYAPGKYTGYAAAVIPGINESIDRHDLERTREQIGALIVALSRATRVLEGQR